MAPTTTYGALTDSYLTRAIDRAWREAARCYQEARREPNASPVKATLLRDADMAQAYWQELVDEAERRLDLLAGDASIDEDTALSLTYEAIEVDGQPVNPKPPVTRPAIKVAPWVTKASEGTLPAGGAMPNWPVDHADGE